MAFTGYCISDVVALSPNVEMIHVDTATPVAGVIHLKTVWDGAMNIDPCPDVSTTRYPVS